VSRISIIQAQPLTVGSLEGICHPSAHAQQFDFLSDGTFFEVDICERNPFPDRPYEACKNSTTDIEELFSQP